MSWNRVSPLDALHRWTESQTRQGKLPRGLSRQLAADTQTIGIGSDHRALVLIGNGSATSRMGHRNSAGAGIEPMRWDQTKYATAEAMAWPAPDLSRSTRALGSLLGEASNHGNHPATASPFKLTRAGARAVLAIQ